jgi:hypothetical protein
MPDLDQVRDEVARDRRAARRQEASAAFDEALRAGCDVKLDRPRSVSARENATDGAI